MRHLVVGCSGVPSSRPVTQVPHSSSTAVRFSRCVICVLQPLPPLDPRIFGARTTSTCDVGVCNERRQTVCTEPFRLGNAAHRRDALRVRNAAFLIAIWGQLPYRLQVHVRDGRVRLYTTNGADWSKRRSKATPARRTAGRRSSYSGIRTSRISCNAVRVMT